MVLLGRRGCAVMILRCSLTGQAERRIEDSEFGPPACCTIWPLRGTKAGPWFDSRIAATGEYSPNRRNVTSTQAQPTIWEFFQ